MATGSSPLARGTGPLARPAASCPRFIPAGAGNSNQLDSKNRRRAVHPRWRGEQDGISALELIFSGSSPLARGTGHAGRLRDRLYRFIPAGAGNRHKPLWIKCCPSVHPRWRGEQAADVDGGDFCAGSSPLARGTVFITDAEAQKIRFIPAGAGNRRANFSPILSFRVHPRWRGEQFGGAADFDGSGGSSPLARGTGRQHPPHAEIRRFIPAGAGNRMDSSSVRPS